VAEIIFKVVPGHKQRACEFIFTIRILDTGSANLSFDVRIEVFPCREFGDFRDKIIRVTPTCLLRTTISKRPVFQKVMVPVAMARPFDTSLFFVFNELFV
jgi:hypothetical protein